MPLFGSNNNDSTTIGNTGYHHLRPTTDTAQGFPGGGQGATGTGAYPTSHTGAGLGFDSNHNGPTNTFAPGSNSQQSGGNPFSDNSSHTMGSGGAMGGGAHLGGGRGIPPTSADHNTAGPVPMGTGGTGGGVGHSLTGKVERAVGNLIGSQSLQAKGAQKELEAGATKMQGRELAEAERLENEALMRRQGAVGHGAHPANSNLGAGNIGQGGVGSGMPGGFN
ncbi:hypothetical protein HYPSUDRAFT_55005 [Hypholoma sublateritium FD-334 SS-4]|uniref:CsbD-like domain-containing protein n=1 Tax=Hypholoma sublateritium (strain FD-334 SS-4) TaxID=945553 RepID=A0A0D2P012_HYPSF|nr:hypothetical protein HYPSUDRAFT_55005 [Hypholoma sublateritium FD-334 SS-4]